MRPRITFRRSLRLTLVLYVILPLIGVVVVAGTSLLYTFETRIVERMKDDVQLVARALEIPVAQAVDREETDALQGALESAIGINRVYGAYVYDLQGRTVGSTGPMNPASDEAGLSRLARSGDAQERYDEVSGRRVYSYFVPLAGRNGLPTGLLHVTRRERDIRTSVADLRMDVAILSLGAVLLVSGLVLYGHRESVGRHLDRIRDGMRRVEQGDRSHRVPSEGPKELAEVASALNTMLDSVERAQQDLRTSRAEQRDLKSRLRQAEKLAAIGTLAAGVAHELGTPLSVIAGKAERMLRREELNQDVRQALRDTSAEVRRMEHIVRQLLDFGRRYDPSYRRVLPGGLVASTQASMVDEAANRGVEIQSAPPPEDRKIVVDPLRIEQALTNLIGNAVDAARRVVRVSWLVGDDVVRFIVEDDGPGVDEGILERIFEPFFTTKRVGRGTGLGLAVVHGIAEEHGGTVRVGTSRLGGARFEFCVPVRPLKEHVAS